MYKIVQEFPASMKSVRIEIKSLINCPLFRRATVWCEMDDKTKQNESK